MLMLLFPMFLPVQNAVHNSFKSIACKVLFELTCFANNGSKAFTLCSIKKQQYKSATQRCLIKAIWFGSKKKSLISYPFLTIVTLLISSCIFAQNASKIPQLKKDLAAATNDSDRADVLQALCFDYSNVNPDTAILYGNEAMQISTKINYARGIADSYNNLGWAYYCLDNTGKAEEYFKKSLELYTKTGRKDLMKAPLANLGTLYMDKTEYSRSLTCFMQVLKYEDGDNLQADPNLEENKQSTLHEIGRLYNLLKKPDEARKYFQQALLKGRELKSDIYIGQELMSVGNTYQMEGDQKNALNYYDQCLQYLSRTTDNLMLGLARENIANSYFLMKKYDKAIVSYKQAKEYYMIIKSKGDLFEASLGLAEVYRALKDSANGMHMLNEALRYSIDLNNKNYQQQVILALSNLFAQYGDYKKAYQYLDSSYKIKDSLFTLEKQDELLKLQTQFETERKEKEIALLKKDQQLNQASLQKNKTFQYAAYIILFLLALTGFLVVNRYRTVQRAKRLIEIEQVRNNIARNLHDDIGSTLTSINILSKVALQQTPAGNQASVNMQKIKDRSSAIMESMNDIVWSINPANDALDKIILRMKEFGTETLEQAGIQAAFHEEGELNNIKLSLTQRNDLYLIFKEALNNAVKYSGASAVHVDVKKENSALTLQVTDNGKGFNAQQQFSGNGLKNMQSRATDINASLQIKSSLQQGTTVVLSLPIT